MAKRSRRARRQRKPRQRKPFQPAPPPRPPDKKPEAAPPPVEAVQPQASLSRKMVDFTQEYYYVYREIRTFIIISVLMFVVLVGLSFVI